jgi:mono/diheme cytochrome c family protein
MIRCPRPRPRARGRVWLTLLLALLPLVPAAARAATRTGAEVYAAACASCHGADGRSAPRPLRGFDLQPPDLADCDFATREAKSDWRTVVREGGPARGFEAIMPAFGDALAPAEIDGVLDHARAFCADAAWPRGDLNFPRAMMTEKAFVEDEVVLSAAVATGKQGAVANKLIVEKRILARTQIEAIVPFGWLEGDDGVWRGGIGDVAFGAKRVLLHSVRTGSILSVAGEVVLPTGNVDRGLGKGVTRFEPFVSFGQRLPAGFHVQLQAGAEIPTDTDKAAVEVFWRGALGATLRAGRFDRGVFPMIEVVGVHELEDAGKTSWDLVPQVQVALNRRQHLRLSVGASVPLTDTGTRKPQVLAFLLWDFFDGGLLEGW